MAKAVQLLLLLLLRLFLLLPLLALVLLAMMADEKGVGKNMLLSCARTTKLPLISSGGGEHAEAP